MKTNSKILERKLSKTELETREKIIKDLIKNKSSLVKRYGKDAEKVMYGRSTNIAKKIMNTENKHKIKELVKRTLMKEQDIEVGADKYDEEQTLSQASNLLDEFESLLQTHDWHYEKSDDPRVFTKGDREEKNIKNKMKQLISLGHGGDAISLFNRYNPYNKQNESFPDLTGDGKVTRADILKGRGVDINEKMSQYKVGDKIKWSSPKGEVEDEITRVDGIYLFLKSGGSIPYQSVVSGDLKEGYYGSTNVESYINTIGYNSFEEFFGDNPGGEEALINWIESIPEFKIQLRDSGMFGDLKEGSDFSGTGLIVVGKSKKDNDLIDQAVEESGFYGVYNSQEDYWFFPESEETIDRLENELENIFIKKGANVRYEAQFNESLSEDLDIGHTDNEPHMIKGDLYRIGKYAMELYKVVSQFEYGHGKVDFPHWWQSKIIRAKEMLVAAKHYLDFETKEPAIDAMVGVASDEEVIDENKIKMYYHVLEDGGYGRIGHQGYFNTKEEAQKRANTLSDMFPRSSFYVEAYPSKKEPVTVTMEENKIGKDETLSSELYKLKGKITPAFFDKIRKFINMGSLEDAEYLLNRVKGQMKEKGLDSMNETKNIKDIKVGDIVSKKYASTDEDYTKEFEVISITGTKAILQDVKTGKKTGIALSDLTKTKNILTK